MWHFPIWRVFVPMVLCVTAHATRILQDENPVMGTKGLQQFSNSTSTDATSYITSASSDDGFIGIAGTSFSLNGRPWYCAGTNAYYAAIVGRMSETDVDELFKTHADHGATVVRVFAHSDGYSVSQPIQPKLGVYDEVALRRLDLVVATASKYGIRLILPFTNFEPFLGGIRWYADQFGLEKEYFYTDSRIRDAYTNYVTMLVTRKNTLTGVVYKNDPTIFAWELMNEPHTSDGWERSKGITPGSTVRSWIKDMAAMVKSLDQNHLLFTGEEGYRTEGPSLSNGLHQWINNGLKGVDYTENCRDSNIDACTVHAYPDNWGYAASELGSYGPDFVADRAKLAHGNGKPIVMEEYGARTGYGGSRNEVLQYLQNAAEAAGYACTLVWSASAGSFTQDGGGYIFEYSEDGSAALLERYAYAKEKTLQSGS